jgi:hypothetical protein
MEYKAIECQTTEQLIGEVNRLIADGWEPIGGISASLSENDEYQYFVAAQAMIRR